jgi:hypothetical protein
MAFAPVREHRFIVYVFDTDSRESSFCNPASRSSSLWASEVLIHWLFENLVREIRHEMEFVSFLCRSSIPASTQTQDERKGKHIDTEYIKKGYKGGHPDCNNFI